MVRQPVSAIAHLERPQLRFSMAFRSAKSHGGGRRRIERVGMSVGDLALLAARSEELATVGDRLADARAQEAEIQGRLATLSDSAARVI